MKTAIGMFESTNPYSQGRQLQSPKGDKELPQDYEKRCWKERCWVTDDGHIFIPPMQFCNSLKVAAQYLSLKVESKGKETWTKHFDAGVMVTQRLVLEHTIDKIQPEIVSVPSDGRPGGRTRVPKYFPIIPNWQGAVNYIILDDLITESVFRKVLDASAKLIGVGRFRPRNRGYYGTWKVTDLLWTEED